MLAPFSPGAPQRMLQGPTPAVRTEAIGGELDRMLLTQAGNRVTVVTDLLQQNLGVLTEPRHGIHSRRITVRLTRRQQRRDLPRWGVNLNPASSRAQLSVLPDLVHGVHARIRDLGRLKPPNHLLGREL